jgi:aryl-alcohol dehydrogenase-like predicted oxidoreductase
MQTSLPTAPLGRTGLQITRVGFGAWAVGGAGWAFGWGPQDDDASVAAVRHAVEAGVTWVDTAAAYGLGHSEQVVARALADLPEPDRPYVFTKGGLVWDDANPTAQPRRVGEPASLRRQVEASLRRLQVERIDLYQLHWPANDCEVETYWPVFAELVESGKVRAIGLSNHSVAQLEQAEAIAHVDTLQPPFNMLHREAGEQLLGWSADHETGVIVYSPMASGLLSGSFTSERAAALGPDDWRSRAPDFAGDRLQRNLALVDELRPIAERHGVSVGVVAIAWTLAWRGVTGAIVGARSPQQVDGWLAAASLELTGDDVQAIASALHRTGAGTGPARPTSKPPARTRHPW